VVALVLCLFWSALVEEKSKKTKSDRATDKVGHISGTHQLGAPSMKAPQGHIGCEIQGIRPIADVNNQTELGTEEVQAIAESNTKN